MKTALQQSPTIRPYTPEDMPQILNMLKHIGWANQYVEGQKRSIEKMVLDEEGDVYVEDTNGQVRGFIQVQHHQWNRLSFIHGLVTDPDHRRAGIASGLVAQAEHSSQQRGNRGTFVDTPVDNTVARSFYQSQGYTEAYIMPNYYEDNLDGVTYMKFFGTTY